MSNLKTGEFAGGRLPIDVFGPDIIAELRFVNCGKERLRFGGLAFRDEFDAAIRHIADEPGHFKPARHFARAESEPDSLHATGIKNVRTLPHCGPVSPSTVRGAASFG